MQTWVLGGGKRHRLLTQCLGCSCSFLCGRVESPSGYSSHCGAEHPLRSHKDDPAKSSGGVPACLVPVLVVLGTSNEPQIAPAVVQPISIDVIDFKFIGCVHDQAVEQKPLLHWPVSKLVGYIPFPDQVPLSEGEGSVSI